MKYIEKYAELAGESKVRVWKEGTGYFIEVKDSLTENRLAVTYEELEKIVLYGQALLK